MPARAELQAAGVAAALTQRGRRWAWKVGLTILLVGLASGKVASGPDEALVGIRNDTWVAIARIHFAPPNGSHRWGPDVLGGATIRSGEWAAVTLSCPSRDVLVVDVFGRQCVTEEFDACLDNPTDLPAEDRLPGVFATWEILPSIRFRSVAGAATRGDCSRFGRPKRGLGKRRLPDGRHRH